MTTLAARPRRQGFTLLEVMIAMALLLVGGISILSVFTLAIAHRVGRDVDAELAQVRDQVRAMAQAQVDAAPKGKPPEPLVDAPTAQTGFTVTIRFVPSPNGDASWVAQVRIAYRGVELREGTVPPMFLRRNVYERSR
jgi:prepilin-type N-terminal cleavage/methylation domain-containing protein